MMTNQGAFMPMQQNVAQPTEKDTIAMLLASAIGSFGQLQQQPQQQQQPQGAFGGQNG